MASFTLAKEDTFPNGTSVSAYALVSEGKTPTSGAPPGSAVASGTVSGGSVTFAGLADSTLYFAYAASPDRYVRFSTPPPEAAGDGVTVTIAGDPTVGQVLTANVSDTVTSPTYRWQRDGVNISGATSATYTVHTADIDTDVTCVVSGAVSATSNALVGVEGPPADGPAGFTTDNFSHWLAAKAAVLGGTGHAKILVVDDSTGTGFGAGGTNPPAETSYPAKLRDLLSADSLPASLGLSAHSTETAGAADTRWTLGSGWALASVGISGFGGRSLLATDAAGACEFAPGYACNTADIYYAVASLGSSVVSCDGGAGTTLNAFGSAAVGKTTISLGSVASNHVISLAGPTGSFLLIGIDCYDSTTKKVRVAPSAVNGSSTDQWSDDAAAYRSIGCIQAYAPDLTIIGLGINDAANSATAATWKANTQKIITAARLSGDVILKTVIPSNAAGLPAGGVALEQDYAAAAYELAEENGIGVIDINALFVDYATANGLGYMYDNLHGTATGYALIAQTIFDGLDTL